MAVTVELGVAVATGGDITVVDGDVVGCDDRLVEYAAGISSNIMVVSPS